MRFSHKHASQAVRRTSRPGAEGDEPGRRPTTRSPRQPSGSTSSARLGRAHSGQAPEGPGSPDGSPTPDAVPRNAGVGEPHHAGRRPPSSEWTAFPMRAIPGPSTRDAAGGRGEVATAEWRPRPTPQAGQRSAPRTWPGPVSQLRLQRPSTALRAVPAIPAALAQARRASGRADDHPSSPEARPPPPRRRPAPPKPA